ncbi:Ankyrin repeat-containing protein [Spironucleus salmonicida]|uniref:Ankyrin repeat-containing protein n=1 Tax=Spironucleus salmonicida TaxID=348837 RepID=V6LN80_9EUKA|nr:Ankyrin repeat-containing protein [Spironucleus salmonicida]|eukprot:EST45678.1 Ankyrin repeat-containing protein [Spironucleus salmonicida]
MNIQWFELISQKSPDIQAVRKLSLAFGKQFNDNNKTALMVIAGIKNSPIFRILLQKERGIANTYNFTALHQACIIGELNYVSSLHQEADFSLTQYFSLCYKSEYPIHVAARNNHYKIAGDLLYDSKSSGFTENFLKAAQNIQCKLEKNTDSAGRTQLMYIAMNKDYNTDNIIFFGQQQGIIDDSGLSALMYATLCNNIQFVKFAIDNLPKELKLQTTDHLNQAPPGTTALMFAVIYDYTEIVDLLKFSEIEIQNENQMTAQEICTNQNILISLNKLNPVNKIQYNRRISLDRNLKCLNEFYKSDIKISKLQFSGIQTLKTFDSHMSSISSPLTSRISPSANEVLKQICGILGCQSSNLVFKIKEQIQTYKVEMENKEIQERQKNQEENELLERQTEISEQQKQIYRDQQQLDYLKEILFKSQNLQQKNQCEQTQADNQTKGISTISFKGQNQVDQQCQITYYEKEAESQTVLSLDQFDKIYEVLTEIQPEMASIDRGIARTFQNFRQQKRNFRNFLINTCEQLDKAADLQFKFKTTSSVFEQNVTEQEEHVTFDNELQLRDLLSPKRIVVDAQSLYNERISLMIKEEQLQKIIRSQVKLENQRNQLLLQLRQVDNTLKEVTQQ